VPQKSDLTQQGISKQVRTCEQQVTTKQKRFLATIRNSPTISSRPHEKYSKSLLRINWDVAVHGLRFTGVNHTQTLTPLTNPPALKGNRKSTQQNEYFNLVSITPITVTTISRTAIASEPTAFPKRGARYER
jgi:hypothetical protein